MNEVTFELEVVVDLVCRRVGLQKKMKLKAKETQSKEPNRKKGMNRNVDLGSTRRLKIYPHIPARSCAQANQNVNAIKIFHGDKGQKKVIKCLFRGSRPLFCFFFSFLVSMSTVKRKLGAAFHFFCRMSSGSMFRIDKSIMKFSCSLVVGRARRWA